MENIDGYQAWLHYRHKEKCPITAIKLEYGEEKNHLVLDTAIAELNQGLQQIYDKAIPLSAVAVKTSSKNKLSNHDGFCIQSAPAANNRCYITISSANGRGILYGVFTLLRLIQTGKDLHSILITEQPKIKYRMLNHWDNLDGSIERGYAGNSLWKWHELPARVDERYTDYARLCASTGINAAVLNNVNTQPEILTKEYIIKVAAIAAVLRKYGITTYLSVNFGSSVSVGKLETADPCDPRVITWWQDKAAEIYQHIPDFGGFLVKADSEGQPGPFAYGKTHSDGANMLAEALAPYGGMVIWRAFVYGHGENDRAKKAYTNFKPLDGTFKKNVIVQIKNGAIDFQPREPVHPLFGALKKTTTFMELQITQEYLGQGNHLVFLAPMWKEILDFDLQTDGPGSTTGTILAKNHEYSGIAGVTNIGNNKNWCGSLFHTANWYAFGRLTWDPTLPVQQIAREWAESTWGDDPDVIKAVMFILLNSWNACVQYMTPLCLHHIMRYENHYGPDPGCNKGNREDWKPRYYHRADSAGLGFDRTTGGSDAVSQYAPGVMQTFNNIHTCPEKYLLWFHHVPWTFRLASGRTLIEELEFCYNSGVLQAEKLRSVWLELKNKSESAIEKKRYETVLEKLSIQVADAHEWRDVCVPYFKQFAQKAEQ